MRLIFDNNEQHLKLSQSFTTEPKGHKRKGHSPIRQRCIEFIDILNKLGITQELPLSKAKELFMKYMGIMDRTSLKAYFGSQASRSVRKIERMATYQTGTTSFKIIELTQDIPEKKGYLEILGLVTILKRGSTWFMKLNNEPLIAELTSNNEGKTEVSIDKISLTPIPFPSQENESLNHEGLKEEVTVGETSVSPRTERPQRPNQQERGDMGGEKNNNNNNYRVREKLSLENVYKSVYGNLNSEESAILTAKPLDQEPDLARLKCPKIKWQ